MKSSSIQHMYANDSRGKIVNIKKLGLWTDPVILQIQ